MLTRFVTRRILDDNGKTVYMGGGPCNHKYEHGDEIKGISFLDRELPIMKTESLIALFKIAVENKLKDETQEYRDFIKEQRKIARANASSITIDNTSNYTLKEIAEFAKDKGGLIGEHFKNYTGGKSLDEGIKIIARVFPQFK